MRLNFTDRESANSECRIGSSDTLQAHSKLMWWTQTDVDPSLILILHSNACLDQFNQLDSQPKENRLFVTRLTSIFPRLLVVTVLIFGSPT